MRRYITYIHGGKQLLWLEHTFNNMISVFSENSQMGTINIWEATGQAHLSRHQVREYLRNWGGGAIWVAICREYLGTCLGVTSIFT